MGRIRGHVRPNKSNQDNFAVDFVLRVELAASILEFADLRRIQNSDLAVGPIEAPLVSLRIVETQRQAFDVPGNGTIGFELLQLSATIPNLEGDGSTVKFDQVFEPVKGFRRRFK